MKKVILIIGGVVLFFLTVAGAFFLGRYSQEGKGENASAEKNISVDAPKKDAVSPTGEKPADASASPEPVTISASGGQEGEITYTITSTWGDDKTTYTQIDALITNQSDQEVSDWKVNLTVPQGSKMNQSWNGQMKLKGTDLKILPADYNAVIAAGQTVNFGFIIETPSDYVPKESELVLQP